MSKTKPVSSKAPARPVTSFDRTLQNVGHLYRRAGFGATPDQILAAARLGLAPTINALVDYEHTADPFTPPDPVALDGKTRRFDLLTTWWLNRMAGTTRPLQEKMVLFWHGHFATAFSKVPYPQLMYTQNQLFRAHALDTFDALLSAVYKDPAMLIWLDGERNTKQAPNENWGREVMELFVLGRGNYTEDDVHAMARAFTGWTLNRDTGEVRFVPRLHDDSPKILLGQTG